MIRLPPQATRTDTRFPYTRSTDLIDDEEASTLFLRFPEYSFLRARPDQVAWQALALRDSKPGDVVVAQSSAEHTSETSVTNAQLVCRLLLEKINKNTAAHI